MSSLLNGSITVNWDSVYKLNQYDCVKRDLIHLSNSVNRYTGLEILVNTKLFQYENTLLCHQLNDWLNKSFKPIIKQVVDVPMVIRHSPFLSHENASIALGQSINVQGAYKLLYKGYPVCYFDHIVEIDESLLKHFLGESLFFEHHGSETFRFVAAASGELTAKQGKLNLDLFKFIKVIRNNEVKT